MYNIIPLIIILISLSVIIIIVVRKFSALSVLDVDTIQEEKEARFKERIISTRIKRHFVKATAKLSKVLGFFYKKTSHFSKFGYDKLLELKNNYKFELPITIDDKNKKIEELFTEAEDLRQKGEFDMAEKKLIEIIGYDSQNILAFKTLGETYFENKHYPEAKQSYEHLLNLLENTEDDKIKSEVYFDLAEACQQMEENELAIKNMNKALHIEPQNPRYLDTMLELSIINKDKAKALDAYERLAKSDPDNQKLSELKSKVDAL